MPEGGVIDALVAVATESSAAGTRDSPTIVNGTPCLAAARNAGVGGGPFVEAELELRKAICACAVLTSVNSASAAIQSDGVLPFMAPKCSSVSAAPCARKSLA